MATAGEETHAQTVAEMPAHAHGGATQGVSWDGTTLSAGGGSTANFDYAPTSSGGGGVAYTNAANPSHAFQDHRHLIPSQGNGIPFNQLQPSLALLYCQKN
jgi:microcystin-dependent protein